MTLQVEFTARDYLASCVLVAVLSGLVYWQGWIIGILLYIIVYHILAKILKVMFNLEVMGGGDEMFFFDDERNRLNIVAFHRYAKMTDVDEFRTTMLRRACQFPRLKSRVTKCLGHLMFEELSDEQMMASIDHTMPVISDIHNER